MRPKAEQASGRRLRALRSAAIPGDESGPLDRHARRSGARAHACRCNAAAPRARASDRRRRARLRAQSANRRSRSPHFSTASKRAARCISRVTARRSCTARSPRSFASESTGRCARGGAHRSSRVHSTRRWRCSMRRLIEALARRTSKSRTRSRKTMRRLRAIRWNCWRSRGPRCSAVANCWKFRSPNRWCDSETRAAVRRRRNLRGGAGVAERGRGRRREVASHAVRDGDRSASSPRLASGARTTAFEIRSPRRTTVASWYLRLRDARGRDPFFGLVRVRNRTQTPGRLNAPTKCRAGCSPSERRSRSRTSGGARWRMASATAKNICARCCRRQTARRESAVTSVQ